MTQWLARMTLSEAGDQRVGNTNGRSRRLPRLHARVDEGGRGFLGERERDDRADARQPAERIQRLWDGEETRTSARQVGHTAGGSAMGRPREASDVLVILLLRFY